MTNRIEKLTNEIAKTERLIVRMLQETKSPHCDPDIWEAIREAEYYVANLNTTLQTLT